ncbi:MAG: tetratricopeptide repeat protein, partial [Candidatus Sericytochromatia bacterium]|nr:tetratricopeptide repeat protein [Candidatus Tanganyikabacteria bacterium]
LLAGIALALSVSLAPPPAWATPADGLLPDLRGSAAWSTLFGWDGTEMPDGTGHRLVVNKAFEGANYSISLAQARVAGKIDSSYLVAMRDIYSPIEMVTEFETRLDDVVGALCYAMGLNPGQTQEVRNIVHKGIQAEGRSGYHVIVGKLIFHCTSYFPTSVTQGWTLTVMSTSSHLNLARGIMNQVRAQNSRKDKFRLNEATKLRKAKAWRSLYAVSQDWAQELPDSPNAWGFLGEAAMELKRYPVAIDALKRDLQKSRGDTRTWKTLGYAYGMTRKWKESGNAYQKALERNPRDAESLWNLGVAYAYQQRYNALPGVHLRLMAVNPALGDRFNNTLMSQIPAQTAENR